MTQHPSNGGPTQRQFVKFTFFKIDPSWRTIAPEQRSLAREEFCRVADAHGERMLVRSYSLTGLRGDCDFMLWQIAERLEDFQDLATALFSTAMAPHLAVPYSYLSMTRRSIYRTPKDMEAGGADARLRIMPGESAYLFVYPFVKTRPWYELPKDERQAMMEEHIGVGRKYPSVKLNTTYSYGIDDQEFVVSFETDSPSDFLDLVMELRDSRSSAYTLRDTPTFTCVRMPLAQALERLGAPGDGSIAAPGVDGASHDGWTPVAKLSELPEGGAKAVFSGGEQIAIFNIEGTLYAIGNRCSHANGPLAEGRVEGTCVTCPWHNSTFDLTTGRPVGGPAARPVPVYRVRVDGDAILLATEPVETPAR